MTSATELPMSWTARLDSATRPRLSCPCRVCAVGVTLLGAAPMAVASTNPNADPIVSQAIDGTPNAVDYAAPPFVLVNQRGRLVSLENLRGKAVALTFLDPVCVSDCPIIAQEFLDPTRCSAPRLGGWNLSPSLPTPCTARPRTSWPSIVRRVSKTLGAGTS